MYSFLNKPSRIKTIVTLGYLAVGTTYPFLLSYRGSINIPMTKKGVTNIRVLFTKI
ncbi:DEHA2D00836p [Debaryomyces hansenii CBS767]|uniref:DEHA2D00836p n=1 Tax=Debaryomyces hansenii (strain ATCC 36239 / CBS 767 / BCRC 21394 / JCM 1990 / NBRC 0083 / IGC 2968) TaxID=284592 RepID=Q6BTG4_DEBHA|nr:DEHA2D00836p [Debaryomyces hansenii CBS767]CAG86620.1 DEHA2D00836p [Debaryomyces hansenii CBS767]|eukprot:XP_458505.1 DEHA2D00836p [Debaryomyces hansenii CBS767]